MKTDCNIVFVVIALLIMTSCSHGPKEIDYGNDGCHFCKMTIVDKIHGAQLITDKGKVFKFDATECMLNYMTVNKELQADQVLTNYYEAPTAFIATQDATFLVSENLPSPMGANLTAFQVKASAEKIQSEKDGALFTWEELKAHLSN